MQKHGKDYYMKNSSEEKLLGNLKRVDPKYCLYGFHIVDRDLDWSDPGSIKENKHVGLGITTTIGALLKERRKRNGS